MTKKRSFLDEALRQATIKEQERIIKILEEYFPLCYCDQYDPPRTCIHMHTAQELSALIKGEK